MQEHNQYNGQWIRGIVLEILVKLSSFENIFGCFFEVCGIPLESCVVAFGQGMVEAVIGSLINKFINIHTEFVFEFNSGFNLGP